MEEKIDTKEKIELGEIQPLKKNVRASKILIYFIIFIVIILIGVFIILFFKGNGQIEADYRKPEIPDSVREAGLSREPLITCKEMENPTSKIEAQKCKNES